MSSTSFYSTNSSLPRITATIAGDMTTGSQMRTGHVQMVPG